MTLFAQLDPQLLIDSKANQELFRFFLEHTPVAIAMFDRQMRYILASRRWSTDYNLGNQNIIGRSHYEVFSEIPDRWKKIHQRCLAGAVEKSEEDLFPRANGKTDWVRWEIHPWRNSAGEIGGIIMFTEVISDRKQAELALKQSQEELQTSASLLSAVVEGMADPLFVKDLQGRYVTINAAGAKIIGKPVAEIIGKDDTEVFPPEIGRQLKQNDRCIMKTGETQVLEEVVIDKGMTRTFLSTKSVYRDSQGNISGLIGIVRDITARKLAEAALEQANEELEIQVEERTWKLKQTLDRLKKEIADRKLVEKHLAETELHNRYLLDRCPIGLALCRLDGKLVYINPAYAAIMGRTVEETLKLVDWDITPEKYIQQEQMQLVSLRTTGQYGPYEKEYIHKDGHFVPIVSAGLIVEKEGEQFIWSYVQDISDRKQAEAALQESETQLRQKAQQEALLNRVSSQIRQSLDLDTILATTVQQIRSLLQIDRCLFMWYLPNAEPPAWDVVHQAKNEDLFSILGYYPADVTGSLGQTLSNLEIYRVDDIDTILDPVERQFFQSLGYKSLLDVPIQTGSGAIGVVACIEHNYVRSWTDEEVELLQAVCDQLAIAIAQAELYAQSQNSARIAQEKAQQLEQALRELQQTQAQLIQTEKMSSLGQLVAGVAHEINNPVNFIHANLTHVNQYTQDLLRLIHLYQKHYPQPNPEIETEIEDIDLDFLLQDLPKIFNSMNTGTDRIRQIVLSLRNFSRLDEAEMKPVDIHEGIDNTLLILQNRLKANPDRAEIQLIKEYGNLPKIECYAGQLNQVFMNLLTNAIDALEEVIANRSLLKGNRQENANYPLPKIRIITELFNNSWIKIRIADNGYGIPEKLKNYLFDPFFTTKPVGKGTGLGLAISYQIVVEKHGGQLDCISAPGQGTEFAIAIPIRQQRIPVA
jgi:PAS domain S-box-containing protein